MRVERGGAELQLNVRHPLSKSANAGKESCMWMCCSVTTRRLRQRPRRPVSNPPDPMLEEWGGRSVYLHDPDGYVLCFFEPEAESRM